jgi:predicted DNA-binding transcriptional regulator YafY
MRADRLVATLLLLQSHKRVTVAQVAAELEVSERTARRDLEALSTAGIPVYAQPGRGGGWSLVGGSRTDLSGLTAAEARTLFSVVGPAALSDAPAPELRAALRKLVRALPEPFRRSAEAAGSSIMVDAGEWGEQVRPYRPPHLDALQQATLEGVQIRLGYSGRGGTTSNRVVSPLGLVTKASVWYLVANTAAGIRTFRVSRVTAVESINQPVIRPSDFDLAEHWRQIVARVDELRAPTSVRAVARAEDVRVLRWIFGTYAHVTAELEGDRVEVTLAGRDVDGIVRQIAGFGNRLEVIDPPEARRLLAEIGRELTDVYAVAVVSTS